MKRNLFVTVTTALLAVVMAGVATADPLPRTEIRDSVRGVSFISIEISDQQVNSLDVIKGSFDDTDSLVTGVSAMTFDGSNEADEYVFWIRHEGRRWLQFNVEQPVLVEVDGQPIPLEQLRAPQPFLSSSSRMMEKIEFRLDDPSFQHISEANTVSITLSSDSGTVKKTLTEEEIDRIGKFRASLN